MKISQKELIEELQILENLEFEYHAMSVSNTDDKVVKELKRKILAQREKINKIYKINVDELKISIKNEL